MGPTDANKPVLTFRKLTGESVEVNVDFNTKLPELINIVREALKVGPSTNIVLIHNGRELSGNQTITEMHINKNSTIYVQTSEAAPAAPVPTDISLNLRYNGKTTSATLKPTTTGAQLRQYIQSTFGTGGTQLIITHNAKEIKDGDNLASLKVVSGDTIIISNSQKGGC